MKELSESDFEELVNSYNPSQKYIPLEFANSIEFGLYFHPALNSEVAESQISLHQWQIEEGLRFSAPGHSKYNPIKLIICAANGSGKDAYMIALGVVWFAACKIRSRAIITSSSHSQLSAQTEAYIRIIAQSVNDKLGGKVFVIKKQHLFCSLTGSEIKLFATDEPGKAEGYHPFPDYPLGELLLVINEAKSVPDSIYEAFCRCTYSHFLLISSPGQTNGFFYRNSLQAVQYPGAPVPNQWYFRRVSAFDCPHITRSKIEGMRNELGENSPIYRSSILAEFTSLDCQVVISQELVLDRILRPPVVQYKLRKEVGQTRAGADFAAGGDECVSYVVQNGETLGKISFVLRNQVEAAKHLVAFWNRFKHSHGLSPNFVFGDDGGVGRGTIDILNESGWPINRVLNQSAPIWRLEYGNRGAELWFMLARLLECNLLSLPQDDKKLHTQLSNRYYRQGKVNGKLVLEAKAEARANGHGSPDRADAYALAYCGVSPEDFEGFSFSNVHDATQDPAVVRGIGIQEFASWYNHNVRYGEVRRDLGMPVESQEPVVTRPKNPFDLAWSPAKRGSIIDI